MNPPLPNAQDITETDKQFVAALIAQFNSCRAEIQARSNSQAALLNLDLTATGVVAGYFFSAHADPLILLIIAILSPMLGIMWADHAINIGNIGRFIQNRIMPALNKTLKRQVPDYEIQIREFETRLGRRLLLLTAPTVLLFAILPAASVIYVFKADTAHTYLFWTMSIAGIILVSVFGGFSVLILLGAIWKSSPKNP